MDRQRKSLLEARRSVANEARLNPSTDVVPSVEVEPSLAAGGLSPSTAPAASRSKFSMLPTAAAVSQGVETISPIFSITSPQGVQSFGSSEGSTLQVQKSSGNLAKKASMGAFTDETGRSFSPFANPDVNLVKRRYKEHTVEEYAAIQEAFRKNRFGGLGADDSPEKQKAREARKRVLEYGNGVSQLNLMLLPEPQEGPAVASRSPSPTGGKNSPTHGRRAEIVAKKSLMIERALNEEGQIAKLKRERALLYGDILQQQRNQIVAGRRSPLTTSGESGTTTPEPQTILDKNQHHRRSSFQSPPPTDDALNELKKLQARHREDYERIQQLKRDLGVATATVATASTD